MKYLYVLLAALLFFPYQLTAQDEINQRIKEQLSILRTDSGNMRALKLISDLYLEKIDYDRAIRYGKRLQNLAYQAQDHHYMMQSHIILGQAYTMKGERNIAYANLGQAKSNAEQENNDTALCVIYNGLGLYAINIDKDYYRAISCFFQGLELAKQTKEEKMHSILLSNLASIYYLKKDTAGLPYSTECYERGHEQKDYYLIRIGAETNAFMYYLKKDYAKAHNYIKEAEFIVEKNKYNDVTSVYTLHGMIDAAIGNNNAAVNYFKQALLHESTSQPSSTLYAYIQYAHTLAQLKQYDEALELLKQGEAYAKERNLVVYKGELYEMLSQLNEQTGDLAQALAYRKIYQIENDSLFNITKEQAINDLRVKYNAQKLENDINTAHIEQLEKEKKIEFLAACILIILLITGFLFYLYRHQRKLFRAIVQQNRQAIQREKSLLKQLEELKETMPNTEPPAVPQKYAGSSLTDEKGTDLFNRLEQLMREQRIYTDNLLTKDKVAKLLDSNRTYLSQSINEQTGKTFTQYINEYRIREAVNRLSDPAETIPLKALSAELGFNSMTTFYSFFQATTGMTPTQYRKSAQQEVQ